MPSAEPFEMGRQKMICIKILKLQISFFQAVGTMIFTHNGSCLGREDATIFYFVCFVYFVVMFEVMPLR